MEDRNNKRETLKTVLVIIYTVGCLILAIVSGYYYFEKSISIRHFVLSILIFLTMAFYCFYYINNKYNKTNKNENS